MGFIAITGLAVIAWAVFIRSTWKESRRLRNGVYLSCALLLSLLAIVSMPGISPDTSNVIILLLALAFFLSIVVLSVILIANGLTMMRLEGRSLGNMLSLFLGLALVALMVWVGVLIVISSQQYSPENAAWISGLTVGTVIVIFLTGYLGFLLVSFLLYAVVYGRIRPKYAPNYAVVLGSGLINDQVPPLLASRLNKAQKLYNSYAAAQPYLVVSGGQGPDENRSEASAMAEYLVRHGVPAERILLEEESRNTEQNLTFSQQILQEHWSKSHQEATQEQSRENQESERSGDADSAQPKIVVVTNNFHVFRAALLARNLAIDASAVGSPTARYFWPSAALREFIALLRMYWWIHLIIAALVFLVFGLSLLESFRQVSSSVE